MYNIPYIARLANLPKDSKPVHVKSCIINNEKRTSYYYAGCDKRFDIFIPNDPNGPIRCETVNLDDDMINKLSYYL